MTDAPLVGIIVLNFNGQDCLLACLQSLKELTYPNKKVFVVDNGSGDDSMAAAQEQFPENTYIFNTANMGFAAGMNVGLRAARSLGAEWLWVFNNDAVAEHSALDILMKEALGHERAGLLSPTIMDPIAGTLWFGKGRIDFLRMRAVHELPLEKEQQQTVYQSEFLTGCALLIRGTLLDTIGYFDERFFLYYEDADLSVRARAAAFQCVVVPRAVVRHAEQSRENPRKLYHLVLSGLLFFEKHGHGWYKPYFLAYGTIRRIKNMVDGVLGRKNASIVRQAYNTFFHGQTSSHFSHFRQLP